MEKMLTDLRDCFSKAIEEAEASIREIEEILPDQADALRKLIRNKRTFVTDLNDICDEIAVTGDKETTAGHIMMVVDALHQVERIPYLVQVYRFQYT